MKRVLLTIMAMLLICSSAFGARSRGYTYHEVVVKDEEDVVVDTITSIDIYSPDTTTSQTIYSDAGLNNAITLPMTTSSTNTTLTQADGTFYWWGADGYDFSVTDGTNVSNNANHRTRTGSDMTVRFPTYLTATSTTTYTDAQSATFGTSSDWVFSAGTVADTFTAIPATADTSTFNIGSASYPGDFRLFGATSGYNLIWDASEDTLELLDNVTLAVGLGDDYTISHNGTTTTVAGAWTGSGIATFSTDVVFDGTYDIQYDDNRYQLLFQDDAVLGIGGAADAVGDVTLTHDGSDLYMDAAIASEGWLIGDTTSGFDIDIRYQTAGSIFIDYDGDFLCFTDDMDLRFGTGAGTKNGDFMLSSNSSNILALLQVSADTGTMTIGANGTDIPLTWYAESTGDSVLLTGDDLQLEDVSLCLGDGTEIQFGDAMGTGDFTLSSTSAVLALTQVAADTGTMTIGANGTDIPTTWYAETTGDSVLLTGDDLQLEDVSLCLGDGTQIQLGDAMGTGDFQISSTSAVLTIGQVASGTGTIAMGVSTEGIDQTWYSNVAGNFMNWDQDGSTDGALEFEDSSIHMMDDTTIILGDDSDRTIEYDEDGLNTLLFNGDIAGHKKLVEVEASTSETVLATESGKVFVTTAAQGTVTYTLPTASAGLWYTFVDISATAGDDLWITAGASDTINGGTAEKSYKCITDAVPQSVTLMAVDATAWVVIAEVGTWANDNN